MADDAALAAFADVQAQWAVLDQAAQELATFMEENKALDKKSNEYTTPYTRLNSRVKKAKDKVADLQVASLRVLIEDADERKKICSGVKDLRSYQNRKTKLKKPVKTEEGTDQADYETDDAYKYRGSYANVNDASTKRKWKQRWIGEQTGHIGTLISNVLASKSPAVVAAAKRAFRNEFNFNKSIHGVLSAQQAKQQKRNDKRSAEVKTSGMTHKAFYAAKKGDELPAKRDGPNANAGKDTVRKLKCDGNRIVCGQTIEQRLESAEELLGAVNVMTFKSN